MFRSSNIYRNLFLVFFISSPIRIDAFKSLSSTTDVMCGLSTAELIRSRGYNAETHNVITKDGYVLTIFRCNSKVNTAKKKKPVIISHGLTSSSDHFVISPPHQSLVYILADAGYDVWLTNSRGTLYSRKHLFKNPDNPFDNFWNFSWYEIGIYDQAANIDYVLKVTNNSKLYYVGHSQGCTSLMVLLSERPKYNEKIQAASLMAPAGYMKHSQGFGLVAPFTPLLNIVRSMEFLPINGAFHKWLNALCSMSISLCHNVFDFVGGPSENQRDESLMRAFVCYYPSGTSLKQTVHYGQEAKFGHFGKYFEGNGIPRDFQLSRITAPISIHYSTADTLTHPIDTEKLITKLNSSEVTVQKISGILFNHFDFLVGVKFSPVIYSEILNFFERHQ